MSQGSSSQSPRGRGWALTGLTDSMWSVAFGPGGRRLASRSGDNTIIPWDVSLEFWQARACRIANRNLTEAEWNKFIGPDISCERTCPDLPPGEVAPLAASPELPTIVSPTSTPVPPTATPVPPMAAKTPTQTPVPPTATATNTPGTPAPTPVPAAVP